LLQVKFLSNKKVGMELNNIPGIIEHGLFIGHAQIAYFGMEDGTVSSRSTKN